MKNQYSQEEIDKILNNVKHPENDRDHFKQDYMLHGASSEKFLKGSLMNVKLSKLRRLLTSCHFDEEEEFCAVESEIVEKELLSMYGDGAY